MESDWRHHPCSLRDGTSRCADALAVDPHRHPSRDRCHGDCVCHRAVVWLAICGAPRLATSVGLGAVSGAMLGATSIGGPPVILYLLSGPDPIETTRANLTLYVAVTSLIGVAMLWHQGVFDARAGRMSLLLRPPITLDFCSVCGCSLVSATPAFVSSRCCC